VGTYVLFLILFFVLDVPGMTIPGWLTGLEYLLVFFFLVHFLFAARQKDFLYTAVFLSVAQMAFPLIGFVEGNKSALTGSLVELLSQIFVVLGLFMALETLSQKPAGNYPLSKLAGLGRRDFGMALALIVIVFSIVGVPPTGGCFGKYYLLQGLLEKRDWVMLALLSATLLFNLWTVGFFLVFLFKHRRAASSEPIPLSAKAPLYLLALLVLLLGIFHQGVIRNFIEPSLPKVYQNIPLPNVPFLGHQVE
jgi:formate hydrogenlyase subunit 3/multisubunit Na+/H+ antiporter MnhD subunit